ncbi:sensor domain-containing diguanylate cyclase [Agrobacterium rubi]|uniref:diguanylate cyclase n=1 Tax=Agrobacterium rubi TaxID=28099 RepID=A0ABX2JEK5_9HYPH|nr:GGDEF domain-containing protein [Agrobacterium rubi]NTE89338.1 GGDEF domain-containing protein [Agrobacterium rubi]NTF39474.1 GGDEF domain-containing protein [Agrobacterium rubi]
MLRAIFHRLPATINCKDSSGRYVFMNTHQARQLGIEPEEAVGKTTAELFGSEWGEIVRRQDVQVLLTGNVLGPIRENYNSLGCREGYWLTYKFPVDVPEAPSPRCVATISFDITQFYEAEQRLAAFAYTDALTGLLNRRWLDHHLKELEAGVETIGRQATSRSGARSTGVLLVDLDHFKRVNDTWGHEAGDVVLREVAGALKSAVGVEGVAIRLGGEEFVVIIHNVSSAQAVAMAKKVRLAIASLVLDAVAPDLKLTGSVGCALQKPRQPLRQTLNDADAALYEAKAAGRNTVIYRPISGNTLASMLAGS